MLVNCEFCGEEIDKYVGHVNRSRKMGNGLYCDKMCAGLGRRHNRSDEEKKRIKSEYDKEYRKKNFEYVRLRSQEWFKKDYAANPEKYKNERKRRSSAHAEYCRTPEYRKWKKEYDKVHVAKKNYGEMWESSIILNELEKNIDNRLAKSINNLTNKSIKRKRKWLSLKNTQNYLQVD